MVFFSCLVYFVFLYSVFDSGGSAVWKEMFDDLLNIPNCSELPDLSAYRQELVCVVKSSFNEIIFNDFINAIKRGYHKD